MPTLGEVLKAAGTVARPAADYLINRRTRNQVTNTVNQGADVAGRRLDDATRDAVGRSDAALDERRGLYDADVANQRPYQDTGLTALQRYRQMIESPDEFDFSKEPGTQFALDQAFRATDRQFRASGQASNGGQVVRQQRSALDEANRLYNDALARFRALQGDKRSLLETGVGVGQSANNAVSNAGVTLGNAIDMQANSAGEYEMRNAEDQAALDLARSQATATNQAQGGTATSNTIGKLLDAAPGLLQTLAPGIAAKLGLGAATGVGAAGLAGGIAVPSLAAVDSTLAGMAGLGIGAPAAGGTAAGGAGASGGLIGGLSATGVGAIAAAAIAGGLLAKKFIGRGRKAADVLTGPGGIQREFENVLGEIDRDTSLSATDKWAAKEREYETLKQLALAHAQKGSKEHLVVMQMFDEIAPLFGQQNPLRAA